MVQRIFLLSHLDHLGKSLLHNFIGLSCLSILLLIVCLYKQSGAEEEREPEPEPEREYTPAGRALKAKL